MFFKALNTPLSSAVEFISRGRSYERNWFTFGLPRFSKNEPGLKIFLVLYYKKNYPGQKEPLIIYILFVSESILLNVFECIIFGYFHLAPPWSRTLRIYEIFNLFMAHLRVTYV